MVTGVKRAIGLFHDRRDAESALMKLRDSGFDMDRVSVVNKNADTGDMQGATVSNDSSQIAESAGKSAAIGGATGGAIGLIGSLGVLAIPGVGVAAEAGILLANTLFAGGLGAASGGLLGALVGWGLSEDDAKYYSDRVNDSGDYLIVVESDATSMNQAQTVLQQNKISDWKTFDADEETRIATPEPPAAASAV